MTYKNKSIALIMMTRHQIVDRAAVKHGFSYELEALRGFAALFVVWHHALHPSNHFDPGYTPTGFGAYDPPGHLSVLVFFVISGYVIGLTNRKKMTFSNIFPYLRKRALRLYPIYTICLILALIVSPFVYSFGKIIGNFAMLHMLVVSNIYELSPNWSLHYEVLYYLMFIPVALFELSASWLVIGSSIFGLLAYFMYPTYNHYPFLTSYAFGFSFWTAGLWLANHVSKENASPVASRTLVSALLLILCAEPFNRLLMTLQYFKIDYLYPSSVTPIWTMIAFRDFTLFPYCIYFLLLFTNKSLPSRRIIKIIVYTLPSLAIISIIRYKSNHELLTYIQPFIFYCASLLLLILKQSWIEIICKWIINKGIKLGSISYGIYLIHFPIIVFFQQITILSGSALTFIFRFIIYVTVVILLGYILEKKFQSWIKRNLDIHTIRR